jgi:glutamyl-tRNA reductase
MPVVTLGLNHNSAPIAIRERVVFPEDKLQPALRELHATPGVTEAALITTCNRTEVYAVLEGDGDGRVLQQWLEASHDLPDDWLRDYTYYHSGAAAVRHLMNVASGLDSLMLGEPQILGQAKLAHREATDAGSLGQVLDRLFQHAFRVAKQVRSETEIGSHPVSIAYAAVSLAGQIFGAVTTRTALLIGAGETISLTAQHLAEQGIGHLIIANRDHERADALAATHGGDAITLADIPIALTRADIVVSSTGSDLPILGKGSVERTLRERKHRPMFLVDLAVPRDIEPEVGDLADVYLYTIDDLRAVIDDSLRSRREAAQQAEAIVRLHSEQFLRWVRSLDAVAAIREFRERAEAEKEAALDYARRRLARGDDPDDVVRHLANKLTGRLIHEPTMGLREAGRSGDPDTLRIGQEVLGLKGNDNEGNP